MSDASVPETTPGFEFQSSDIDEFCEVLSQRIRPCKSVARSVPHDAALRHHRVGGLGFAVIRIAPVAAVAVDPVDDSYLLQLALTGSFRARCHGPERSYGEGAVHVINPAAPMRVTSDPGCTFLVIRLGKSTFEEHARVLTDGAVDGERLLPESPPIDCGEAASLWRCLRFLHAESMIPGSPLHQGVASRSAEQLLVSLMLAVFERGGAHARSERAVADHVRRAEEYIDGHVDDDIGLVDIVGSAGVDARTLDAGFRRRSGAGPLSWLERRRSERTARELGPRSRSGERAAGAGSDGFGLAPREIEIARLVAAGYNNLEIANGLAISRNTVKDALKRIFRKVGVDSRAELVMRLAEARLL